ncbi:hypothetical protein [Phenylobacterium sp.]|uniref:hypothetical protein n=1 Tax=Phenylobacterium sp. TaxID=1871053 RepID=UPI00374CA9F2
MNEEERRAYLSGYDFLVIDLRGANGADLPRVLGRWLGYVDTNPEAAEALSVLEARADMAAWLAALEATVGPLEGSGTFGAVDLPWSFDPTTYLAERIGLLRRFARGELKPHDFGVRFMYERGGSNSADGVAQRIVAKIAEPAFRELREWLRPRLTAAPASDRVVRIDHNSAEYAEAIAKLDELTEVLRGSNSSSLDPEEKGRIVVELDAGRQLLAAPRVRLTAVRVVLIGALSALSLLFPDFGVNVLASAAMLAVQAVIRSGREP